MGLNRGIAVAAWQAVLVSCGVHSSEVEETVAPNSLYRYCNAVISAHKSLRHCCPQQDKENNAWKKLQMLVMQLRKCCNHPYLFPGAEPGFDGVSTGGSPGLFRAGSRCVLRLTSPRGNANTILDPYALSCALPSHSDGWVTASTSAVPGASQPRPPQSVAVPSCAWCSAWHMIVPASARA